MKLCKVFLINSSDFEPLFLENVKYVTNMIHFYNFLFYIINCGTLNFVKRIFETLKLKSKKILALELELLNL